MLTVLDWTDVAASGNGLIWCALACCIRQPCRMVDASEWGLGISATEATATAGVIEGLCVCVCVSVCMGERESLCVCACVCQCVCQCVCVSV